MENKVVVRHADGKVQKGMTNDFFPNRTSFHLVEHETGATVSITIHKLKAVFFVKDFAGKPAYNDREDIERTGCGRKIRIRFKDGETVIGYTQGFSPDREGYFVFPCDPESNNDRMFVLSGAVNSAEFIQ